MNRYDAAGQLTAKWDGNGNITQFEYDLAGQQTKIIDALGNQTVTAYDVAGRRISTTNPLNHLTTFTYDNANRLATTSDPLNNVTTFGYDAAGNQVAVTNARGFTTTRAYDSRGRVSSVTEALGNTTAFTFDANGNKLTETNALNQTTTMAYDPLNRLISQTDPMNQVTAFAFDAVGNQTSITDANGKVTLSAYNLRNLRITETNAAGGVTTYGYDPVGSRIMVTDAKNATWTYAFDWAGREKQMTQPDNTVEKKAYDVVANLLAKQKPDGNVIRYEYDALKRLVKNDYPTGTDTTFAYDALSRRTQMVDSTGTSTYAYDTLGRLTTYTQPCGTAQKTITYTFDQVGNRLTMTDPDNNVQTYIYDANNRLTSTTAPGAGTTSYIYDALGRVTRQNNGNGTYVLNTFDVAGRLTLLENRKSDASLLSSFAYTMDNVGNRLSITEDVLDVDNVTRHSALVTYSYDNIYRLTSEHRTGYTPFWYEYQYDGAGNRLALIQKDGAGTVTGTTNSTYDAANKLLTSGNITYTWDANGNQTSKTVNGQTTTYVWDYEDKMTSLTAAALTMTYTTDGDGFRRRLSDGTAVTQFIYDRSRSRGTPGIDPLIVETDATGTTTARYIHANGLVSQTRGGTTLWYAYEAIGSTRQLTDASQSVSDQYMFEAFGSVAASTGPTPNPFKYVGNYGYYDDGQSGLMLLGVRYYQPTTGLFLTRDPLDAVLSTTFGYLIGSQNPLGSMDPSGLVALPFLCTTPMGQFSLTTPPVFLLGVPITCSLGLTGCFANYSPKDCCREAPSRLCGVLSVSGFCGIDIIAGYLKGLKDLLKDWQSIQELRNILKSINKWENAKDIFDTIGTLGIPGSGFDPIKTCSPPPHGRSGTWGISCCFGIGSATVWPNWSLAWGLCRPVGCGLTVSGRYCW